MKICQVYKPQVEYVTDDEKKLYQYPLIERYLKKKMTGWNIKDLLESIGVDRIALYSVNLFTELIYNDIKLSGTGVSAVSVADSDLKKAGNKFHDITIETINNLATKYKKKDVDFIIICNVFYSQEIMKNLISAGISIDDITTITNILCWD